MQTNIEGKNILITGASQGIGESVSKYLHGIGANVILVARNKSKLMQMQSDLGKGCFIYPFDLQELNHIETVFIYCIGEGLVLDGLVHCAGVNIPNTIQRIDVDELQNAMNINCFSFTMMGKFFYQKRYSRNHASIIALSSMGAISNEKGMSQYSISKNALNSQIKIMAKEFIPRRIRVNGILPAYVGTNMVQTAMECNEGMEDKLKVTQPFGIIDPIEISYFVEFLLSDCSKSITGSLMTVTAGYSI